MNTEYELPEQQAESFVPKGKIFPDAKTVEHNHAYEDYKASQAVEGLPPGEVADKLELLERLYTDWTNEGASVVSIDPPLRWSERIVFAIWGSLKLSRYSIIQIASEPLRIFRAEIKELALAYAKELNNRKAAETQAEIGQRYIQSQQTHAAFRKFLMEHFEDELMVGTARQQSLYEIAQDIMLRVKK